LALGASGKQWCVSMNSVEDSGIADNTIEPLLNAKQVAKILGLSTFAIYSAARLPATDLEHLASVHFGTRVMFAVEDVRAYIDAHRQAA
jgi:predicted DNA-binding transcriptional regulator AlpA